MPSPGFPGSNRAYLGTQSLGSTRGAKYRASIECTTRTVTNIGRTGSNSRVPGALVKGVSGTAIHLYGSGKYCCASGASSGIYQRQRGQESGDSTFTPRQTLVTENDFLAETLSLGSKPQGYEELKWLSTREFPRVPRGRNDWDSLVLVLCGSLQDCLLLLCP